jgi:lipopolysaccharide transport system ATP-binding protein
MYSERASSEASPVAVSVRNLRKKYRLFASPSQRLKEALHPLRKQFHREFWALNGVSFDVPVGQTLGILGANGSGKSTLLQIIAGILRPTSGSLRVDGKVASLREWGTGFNPEFTGRDNVVLNGSILGISPKEMSARLPAIEAFADIGTFFDQPVKTYSSGMFVRLAFAVAINVDADILIVDEALAVGDAKFQNKCYERFASLQKGGKTIILVTHDVGAVAKHCDRAIVLDRGTGVFDGAPVTAIDRYLDLLYPPQGGVESAAGEAPRAEPAQETRGVVAVEATTATFWNPRIRSDLCARHASYNRHEIKFGNGDAEIVDYLLLSAAGHDEHTFFPDDPLRLLVKVAVKRNIRDFIVGFALKSIDGVDLYATNTGSALLNKPVTVIGGEVQFFEFNFRANLIPGDYFLDIGVAEDDGTQSGSVIEVRRSICHVVIASRSKASFNGLVNLAPNFVHHAGRDVAAKMAEQA